MAADDTLTHFVREAVARGVPRDRTADVLRQAGWTADQVRSALDVYADIEFPVPVPRPRPSASAQEAFTYLLLFTTLYIVAINIGRLLFAFVDQAFPDPAAPVPVEAMRDSLRSGASALIGALPVFLFVAWRTGRAVAVDPTRRASPVRRWLTYLTLFIAACALLGDLTTLVYNVLGGELTTRFVLKVIVVAVIAGTAFWYYLAELRADERQGRG